MKIVGLTGGIAAGKSTVSSFLVENGIPLIDADAIAHDILRPGARASVYSRVLHAFGPTILGTDGKHIDRKRLGEIVFTLETHRRKLNSIVQPAIAIRLLYALAHHVMIGTRVVVLDAPLLFETGLHRICSMRVVVSVDADTQLRRLMARDGAGEDAARARIAAQPLTLVEKAARATHIIDNSGSSTQLRGRVEGLLPTLTACSTVQLVLCGPVLLGMTLNALLIGSLGFLPPNETRQRESAQLLRTWCEPYAREQPRFWYHAAEQHIFELAVHLGVLTVALVLCWVMHGAQGTPVQGALAPRSGSAAGLDRTRAEAALGTAIALCWPLNAGVKLVQGFSLTRSVLELTLLPCHVYTLLSAFTLLGAPDTARPLLGELLQFCSWMPLLALVFPDLDSAKALIAAGWPLAARASVAIFWGFHLLLLATPVCIRRLGRVPGSSLRSPGQPALSLTVYVAFMFLHSGLLLTSAALITGHNLNYSLWPPPKLPVALVEALGGKGYRLSIGCCLSFVIGPLMRHAVVPAVTAAWGALWWLRS
eukprot:jgi/Chrpa1/20833/Chrysochromulina_OHIO_Genome00006623-RA